MNKLVNFFTSTYYDNIKYKHSTASLLKIFFERANKTTQTVASLGNVYRNSKWSDLKVQNIKVTHIRGFLVALVLFISFIILCYLLVFRSENSTISTLLKPLTFLWSYFADWTVYFFTSISLFFYYIQLKVSCYMNSIYSALFNRKFSNQSSTVPVLGTPITKSQGFKYINPSPTFRSSNVNLRGADGMIRHAYRVSDIMSELDLLIDKPDTPTRPISNTNRAISAYLDANHVIRGCSLPSQLFSLVDLEVSFANSAKLSAAGSANKLRLDGGALSLTNAQPDLHNLLNHSVKENLSVGKQTRWLLRSLPISECLSTSNFTYSQAKLLVGNPSFNSTISSKNIWASAKANDLKPLGCYDSANHLLSNEVASNSIINFFEDSRSFINKKAYFTLQPRLNTTSLSPSLLSSYHRSTALNNSVSTQDALVLDMNILLLSNTLSSGNLCNHSKFGSSSPYTDLFYTNDYLSYFTSSHDNFIVSLNSSNVNHQLTFNFFSTISFTPNTNNIKL